MVGGAALLADGVLTPAVTVTTAIEGLRSIDFGHRLLGNGQADVYATWPPVKLCLILNYLGQGAWILDNANNADLAAMEGLNLFYLMLPEQLRVFANLFSAAATVIASQALITGSFTLVSEATRLDLTPHMQIAYSSETKGQLHIPLVNNTMWVGTAEKRAKSVKEATTDLIGGNTAAFHALFDEEKKDED